MINPSKKRVLVTGSSGFIGTNLLDGLIKEGYEIRGLDIRPPRKPAHAEHYVNCNIENGVTLREQFESFAPEIVVHLGARTDLSGTHIDEYSANHLGTRHVMEACSSARTVERVLFASSRLVNAIGDHPSDVREYSPSTKYGESKVLGEEVVREAGALDFCWSIVRPTSIWGPWFGVPYRDFFDAVLSRRYVHPANVKVLKSFGYVGNTVYQILCLLRAPVSAVQGETFYLMDYDPIEVGAFANRISAEAGSQDVLQVPLWTLRVLSRLGDVLGKLGHPNLPLTTFRLQNLLTTMIYDSGALQRITGSLPYTTELGIKETVQWMREQR